MFVDLNVLTRQLDVRCESLFDAEPNVELAFAMPSFWYQFLSIYRPILVIFSIKGKRMPHAFHLSAGVHRSKLLTSCDNPHSCIL